MNRSEQTRKLLLSHYQTYPLLQIQDVFKFLFQSAFGCEHMLSSLETAINYIQEEYESCSQEKEPYIEQLDGDYCRVHLSYLSQGLSANTLGHLFFFSAREEENGKADLATKLNIATGMIKEGLLPFEANEFEQAAKEWAAKDFPALHHSDVFRKVYNPSYRVVANRFIPFLPLFTRLDKHLSQSPITVAIDGGSASGKTTLSKALADIYDCTVFHMDDFFLRPEQRTQARYTEPGGNVDRERFLEEVLLPLSKGDAVTYRPFNCSTMTLEVPISITPKKLVVVEGAYSMHPNLANYYDLSVFLDVSPELQKERVSHRNTPEVAQRFFNTWIPLEEKYFSELNIKEQCDIVIRIAP